MDAFQQEQLDNNFESPDAHVLVAFLVPCDETLETAKNLFCGVACEIGLKTTQYGLSHMEASCLHPFSACIKMKLQMHPTKGHMAVLRYKRKHFTLLAVNSFLAAPLAPSCPHETLSTCNDWWECRLHCEAGLAALYNDFFNRFKIAVIQNNISYTPPDNLPVRLDGKYICMNQPQSGDLSFQEKQMFYVDIPDSAIASNRQWVMEITASKKISLSIRYSEPPTILTADHTQSCSKFGNSFRIICILDHLTNPKLIAGRWFVSIRGSSLFFKSTFTIICKLQPYPSLDNMENEEEWVMIGDDSTPEGRKGKAKLIKSFPETSVPIPTRNSQAIPVKMENIYSTSSSDSDFALAGQFSDLYFSNIPNSYPSMVSTDSGSDSVNGKEVPPHFVCPISCQLMQKPVIAADGHTYELSYIEKWLDDHIRSPMTGEEMEHKFLIANFNLKSQIDEWKSKQMERDSDLDFELL